MYRFIRHLLIFPWNRIRLNMRNRLFSYETHTVHYIEQCMQKNSIERESSLLMSRSHVGHG